MAYLYGNSEPFPGDFDFLSAFEAFVEGAAAATRLLKEVQEIESSARAAKEERERSLEQLERFHESALESLKKSRPEGDDPALDDYLEKVSENASTIVERAKKDAATIAKSEAMKTEATIKEKRGALGSAIAGFLTKLILPIEKSAFFMRLEGGWPRLATRVTSPERLEAEFLLPSARLPDWQGPRHISEFVAGLKLPVDVKKGWFSSSVQHQLAVVDEFIIGGFTLEEKEAEIRLKRKAGEEDLIVLNLERQGDKLAVWFRRPGTQKEKQEELDDATRKLLGDLWKTLRESCEKALGERERLIKVSLDDKDVVEEALVAPLVRIVATLIKPSLDEVAKHSPNPSELSMKLENEEGRREEIYLKKADLAAKLEGLDPEIIAILEL